MKLIMIVLIMTLLSCQSPNLRFKQEKALKGDNTKLYTVELTELGLRRVKLALSLLEKGVEYERGYKYNDVFLMVTSAILVGVGSGFWLGRIQ